GWGPSPRVRGAHLRLERLLSETRTIPVGAGSTLNDLGIYRRFVWFFFTSEPARYATPRTENRTPERHAAPATPATNCDRSRPLPLRSGQVCVGSRNRLRPLAPPHRGGPDCSSSRAKHPAVPSLPTSSHRSAHRSQSHQAAPVGFGAAQTSGEGTAQRVGVGDFQPTIEGHGEQGHRVFRCLFGEGLLLTTVYDQLVLVPFRQVPPLHRFLHHAEARGVLALQQPAPLVARGDVRGGFGGL